MRPVVRLDWAGGAARGVVQAFYRDSGRAADDTVRLCACDLAAIWRRVNEATVSMGRLELELRGADSTEIVVHLASIAFASTLCILVSALMDPAP